MFHSCDADRLLLSVHTCAPVAQVPSAQLKQLSTHILQSLQDKSLPIIADDVWTEDTACFLSGGLYVVALHTGSRCIITSRGHDLARETRSVEAVALNCNSVGEADAVSILAKYVVQGLLGGSNRPEAAVLFSVLPCLHHLR